MGALVVSWQGVPETMLTSLASEWLKNASLWKKRKKEKKKKRKVLVLRCGASDFFHSVLNCLSRIAPLKLTLGTNPSAVSQFLGAEFRLFLATFSRLPLPYHIASHHITLQREKIINFILTGIGVINPAPYHTRDLWIRKYHASSGNNKAE